MRDLVPIDGDPFEDISILGDPETAPLVIMRAGKIHRNELQ